MQYRKALSFQTKIVHSTHTEKLMGWDTHTEKLNSLGRWRVLGERRGARRDEVVGLVRRARWCRCLRSNKICDS